MLSEHQLAHFFTQNGVAYFLGNGKIEFPIRFCLGQYAFVHDELPDSLL